MGGEGWRRSTAMRRGGIKPLFQSSLSTEESPDHPEIDLEDPTWVKEVSDYFDVKSRVDTLQFLLETVSVRRGRR